MVREVGGVVSKGIYKGNEVAMIKGCVADGGQITWSEGWNCGQ